MKIIPYRRHSADCKHKDDRYHPPVRLPSLVSIQLVATGNDAGWEKASSRAEQTVCRDPNLVASSDECETA